jgi:phosphate transport system protein
MEHIETKLNQLKENLLDIANIVKIQFQKSKSVVVHNDQELATEVIENDRRINIYELQIDQDCKNILALYNPVAIDLRFILSSLKISLYLERIGNYVVEICATQKEINRGINPELLDFFELNEMFDKAVKMINNILEALENKDTKVAGKTFKKDSFLNRIDQKAIKRAVKWLKKSPDDAWTVLHLLDIIRKIENIGDLSKNISEEIIFHLDAKILKNSSTAIKE